MFSVALEQRIARLERAHVEGVIWRALKPITGRKLTDDLVADAKRRVIDALESDVVTSHMLTEALRERVDLIVADFFNHFGNDDTPH